LPKNWDNIFPQSFPIHPKGDVIWITNPHNPTGQLWKKKSLEEIIKKYKLVICDEAFLSITPNGEKESLIPLTKKYDNLLVLRSLTKIFNIPGLRLGYVIGSSEKLNQWKNNRDPWPLNSFAIKVGVDLLSNKKFYEQWTKKIHHWINIEGKRVFEKLSQIKNLKVHNSSTNFFLIESKASLSPNIKYLENKGILIRECTSFKFLDENWARISLQTRKNNDLLCKEIQNSFRK
jgi:histidinol-phosphate/aromatic aminotransferase/cobyric acid decarboxylase-like protein